MVMRMALGLWPTYEKKKKYTYTGAYVWLPTRLVLNMLYMRKNPSKFELIAVANHDSS